ncbi:putative spermatogenesis-associated protein 31C2 [Echinops telfairi]|uniref:Spermatogenesis-associated protein 31C2 n=1 Tax=Echinops telfairi TaxID=9371 RepID=A0ABM0ZTR4_ECHTE|nr:putative spermatogenesis-associated protein 31C2 [Echinops telfairi]
MESYLCVLRSITATLLNSSCLYWAAEIILAIGCGVWLSFLLFSDCPVIPPSGSTKKPRKIRTPQVDTWRNRKRNKHNPVQALGSGQNGQDEEGHHWVFRQTQLGESPDKGRFHLLKYSDPSDAEWERTPAEVRQQLGMAPGGETPSTVSAPLTRPPQHLAFTALHTPPEDLSHWKIDSSSSWKTTSEGSSSGSAYYLTPSVTIVTDSDGSSLSTETECYSLFNTGSPKFLDVDTREASSSSDASLHREFLVAKAGVSWSSSPLQPSSMPVNGSPNACSVQASSPLSKPQPSPPSEIPTQPSVAPTPPPQAPVFTEHHLQSSSGIPPPPSTARMEVYGTSCPKVPNETQSSVAQRSREEVSPQHPSLPRDKTASEPPKVDTNLPGDTVSKIEIRKHLEQLLQKRLIQNERGPPSRIQTSLKLAKPPEKLPGVSQTKAQPGPPRPVSTRQSSTGITKNLGKGWGCGPENVPKQTASQAPEKTVVRELRHRKELANALTAHLDRKLRNIVEGKIPICVRRSWLIANLTLPKSDHNKETGNLLSSEDQGPHVNTIQKFTFLDPGMRQTLEAHMIRFRVRQNWNLPGQGGEPTHFNSRETQSPPLSQHESWAGSEGEAAKLQEDCSKKVTSDTSIPIQKNPALGPLSSGEDVKASLSLTLLNNNSKLSEVPQGGQKGRQPFQPLPANILSRTSENRNAQGVNSDSLELTASPPMKWKGPRRGSVSCLDLRGLETPWKHPAPPRMHLQDLENTKLNPQMVGEKELKIEVGTAKSPQGYPSMLPQAGASGVLSFSDGLAFQASQSHPHCVSHEHMPVWELLSDMMGAGESHVRHQDLKGPILHAPCGNPVDVSAPPDRTHDYRRSPKPNESQEGLAGLESSPACGMRERAQEKGSVKAQGIKSPKHLPIVKACPPTEKGNALSEGPFRKKMRSFFQRICTNKKDKGQQGPLQRGKPASASAQSPGSVKYAESSEMKTIMLAIDRSLQELYAAKLNEEKNKGQRYQDPVGESSPKFKPPCSLEHRSERCYAFCCHHVTLENQCVNNEGRNPCTKGTYLSYFHYPEEFKLEA